MKWCLLSVFCDEDDLKEVSVGGGEFRDLELQRGYLCGPPRVTFNFGPDDFLIDESWFHLIIITSEWVPKKQCSRLVSSLLFIYNRNNNGQKARSVEALPQGRTARQEKEKISQAQTKIYGGIPFSLQEGGQLNQEQTEKSRGALQTQRHQESN